MWLLLIFIFIGIKEYIIFWAIYKKFMVIDHFRTLFVISNNSAHAEPQNVNVILFITEKYCFEGIHTHSVDFFP